MSRAPTKSSQYGYFMRVHAGPEWLWYGFFGKLIGYGYRPWNAFYMSLAVIAFGWLIFRLGFDWNLITPTDDKAFVISSKTALDVAKDRNLKSQRYLPKVQCLRLLHGDICTVVETRDR
jgi:hypothetical protein